MTHDLDKSFIMTIEKVKNIYSDEVRLALLEQSINNIDATLIRFEKRFDQIDDRFNKIDDRFNKIDDKFSKIDVKFEKLNETMLSHFKWTIVMIFGLYSTVIWSLLGAVGKAFHWF